MNSIVNSWILVDLIAFICIVSYLGYMRFVLRCGFMCSVLIWVLRVEHASLASLMQMFIFPHYIVLVIFDCSMHHAYLFSVDLVVDIICIVLQAP